MKNNNSKVFVFVLFFFFCVTCRMLIVVWVGIFDFLEELGARGSTGDIQNVVTWSVVLR